VRLSITRLRRVTRWHGSLTSRARSTRCCWITRRCRPGSRSWKPGRAVAVTGPSFSPLEMTEKGWPAGLGGGPTPEITTRKGNPMQKHHISGRHRPGPGRPSPAELGATFPRARRVAVRPRVLRRRVAAAAAGIILAGAGVGWVVDAHADTGTE